jgi:hypothetical protein
MTDTASLRSRIDKCVTTRAALEERKKRAVLDLEQAEADLTALGLKPKTARAAIEAAEAELSGEVLEVERQLGITA